MNEIPNNLRAIECDESSDSPVYDYTFNLDSNRAASRVARLVGKNKTILEVGCGPGSQSRVFHEQLGCEVIGIEIDQGRAEKAKTYCKEVHVADLETADLSKFLRKEKFDVVVCADILEHLRNPESLLPKLKDFMKPDGYLVASIPNFTHASIVYELIHGRFAYKTQGLLDATHVKFFSCASALSLVENSGFWIAELQKVHSQPQHTEFKTTPISSEDKSILAAIRARNPDADTYQFVIKAYPISSSASSNNAFTMREEIRLLQAKISSYDSELRRLKSIIDWYSTPFLTRIIKKINLVNRGKFKRL